MKKIEVMILNVIFSISITEDCGAGRDRTDDLLNAIQALSQLSYGPIRMLRHEGAICCPPGAGRLGFIPVGMKPAPRNLGSAAHEFKAELFRPASRLRTRLAVARRYGCNATNNAAHVA